MTNMRKIYHREEADRAAGEEKYFKIFRYQLWLRRGEIQSLCQDFLEGRLDSEDLNLKIEFLCKNIDLSNTEVPRDYETNSQFWNFYSKLEEYLNVCDLVLLSDSYFGKEGEEGEEAMEDYVRIFATIMVNWDKNFSPVNYNDSSVLQGTVLFFSIVTGLFYVLLKPGFLDLLTTKFL